MAFQRYVLCGIIKLKIRFRKYQVVRLPPPQPITRSVILINELTLSSKVNSSSSYDCNLYDEINEN